MVRIAALLLVRSDYHQETIEHASLVVKATWEPTNLWHARKASICVTQNNRRADRTLRHYRQSHDGSKLVSPLTSVTVFQTS